MESKAKRQVFLVDDKFQVLRQIGEGGFGGIYLVKVLATKKYAALKLNRGNDSLESQIS
jgi:serine/threonine protein kinase